MAGETAFPQLGRAQWAPRWRTADAALLAIFAATLFVSSTLLFLVEPLVGKMLLPILGGTPAVWNTCVVFFQIILVAGYGYAHLSSTVLGVRRQATMHQFVMLLPLLVLPIVVVKGTAPPSGDNPVWWLLWRLLVTVGVPFFALSTTAPLLQRWFAGTGHPAATDPYFLYAASNAGSLLALLAYPLLVEPQLALAEQSHAWAGGYLLLVVLVTACAAALLHARPQSPGGAAGNVSAPAQARCEARPTWWRRLRWVFMAFIPSSLMLGVTTHITTDLAAVPLLWVIPLALYLLTFIVVFARKPLLPASLMARIMPVCLVVLATLFFTQLPALRWLLIALHLAAFFVIGVVCHGRLAADRPAAAHLTEYYLWMSVGGGVGGLFNAIVAPLMFVAVVEYPLVMMLACLALPTRATSPNRENQSPERKRRVPVADFLLPAALGLLTIAVVLLLRAVGWAETVGMIVFGYIIPLLVCYSFRRRPLRFAFGFGALVAANLVHASLREGRLLHIERNFFGVKQVLLAPDGRFRVLVHGGTVHGSQSVDPARSGEPTTYYHRHGPIGDVFALLRDKRPSHDPSPQWGRGQGEGDEPRMATLPQPLPEREGGQGIGSKTDRPRVGVIGLGAGTVACYAEPGDHFTFYEIDPGVARLAADPRYFSYLGQCRGTYDIVLGDGRLTLAAAPRGSYDLLILDAFSSDSIPTHLVTREALDLYVDKLADGGMLAFHVSNQYLRLSPLLANLAAQRGLVCYGRADRTVSPEDKATGKTPSEYVVMARRVGDVGLLARDGEYDEAGASSHGSEDKAGASSYAWQRLGPNRTAPVWTDQYSNILSILR